MLDIADRVALSVKWAYSHTYLRWPLLGKMANKSLVTVVYSVASLLCGVASWWSAD